MELGPEQAEPNRSWGLCEPTILPRLRVFRDGFSVGKPGGKHPMQNTSRNLSSKESDRPACVYLFPRLEDSEGQHVIQLGPSKSTKCSTHLKARYVNLEAAASICFLTINHLPAKLPVANVKTLMLMVGWCYWGPQLGLMQFIIINWMNITGIMATLRLHEV